MLRSTRFCFLCPQEVCKKLHMLIDKIDEERYDIESKVGKANKEVNSSRPKPNHPRLFTQRKLTPEPARRLTT